MKRDCSLCEFVHREEKSERSDWRDRDSPRQTYTIMRCRRYPPTRQIYDNLGTKINVDVDWPTVSLGQWCGEFVAAPTPESSHD